MFMRCPKKIQLREFYNKNSLVWQINSFKVNKFQSLIHLRLRKWELSDWNESRLTDLTFEGPYVSLYVAKKNLWVKWLFNGCKLLYVVG